MLIRSFCLYPNLRSAYILSSFAIANAFTPTELAPSTIVDGSNTVVVYWSPITTLPPQPISTSAEHEHLELRAAPVAPAPVAEPVPAAQPAAQPAVQQPKPAAGEVTTPAAVQQPKAAADEATTPAAAVAAQQSKAAAAAAAQASKAAAAQAVAATKAAAAAGAAPAVGVGGAGAAPAPAQPAATNPGQVPTVTHYQGTTWVGGVPQQVAIVYTQKFSDVPSPGPTPKNGAIGLGTITGPVGVVKTGNAKSSAASTRRRDGLSSMAAGAVLMMLGATMMWI